MVSDRLRRRDNMKKLLLPLLGLAMCAGAVAVGWQPSRTADAQSSALCGTTHDALDTQELEFLHHLVDWRASVGLSGQLQTSAPLSAAAAWFAQHLVEEGIAGPTGHHDHNGNRWPERAVFCGYPQQFAYGSGEGVSFLYGSGPITVSPSEAVYGGTIGNFQHQGVTYPGSGAYINAGAPWPAKCVGAAHYSGQGGTAWIVIIAQYPADQACPQALTFEPPTQSDPTTTSTPSVTNTPTNSPTPTRTPSPTPTPTQEGFYSFAPQVVSNPD